MPEIEMEFLAVTATKLVTIYRPKPLGTLFVCKSLFNQNNETKAEHAVAQLVEALRYKPEGRGFDSRWCQWNFSLI